MKSNRSCAMRPRVTIGSDMAKLSRARLTVRRDPPLCHSVPRFYDRGVIRTDVHNPVPGSGDAARGRRAPRVTCAGRAS